ncbi:unnamed protein product [Rotaria socialis]|uniref:TIR domain-containing protein n=1 Tax=Rotaria socialis TaxID=392032 RepID=A0A820NF84_9BILA|nr:unnamed protein product [Rotaria socialis]
MDLRLQQPVAIIQRLCKPETNVTTANVNGMLDDLVTCLNNAQNQPDGLHTLTAICYELTSIKALKLLDNEHIMQHELFNILGRTLEMLLTKATFIPMTKHDEQCFYEASNLIANLCLYTKKPAACSCDDAHDELNLNYEQAINEISYATLFLTNSFLNKLARILSDDLSANDYEPYHVKYKVIGRLLCLCTELNNINHSVLIDPVVQCLRSDYYRNAYETIDLRQPIINSKQRFFIYLCLQFIRLRSNERNDEVSNSLCDSILGYGQQIFEQHLPIALESEAIVSSTNEKKKIFKSEPGAKLQALGWHIELLNHIALTPTARIHFLAGMLVFSYSTDLIAAYEITSTKRILIISLKLYDAAVLGTHQIIIDHMINIIRTESLIASVHENDELFHSDVHLVSCAITLLYNLTFENKILLLLKEKNLAEFCTKLHTAKQRTIQFASQTLSILLNQNNIDAIKYPLIMAQNYLFYIENTLHERSLVYNGVKLNGALTYLELMAQNDLIKNEIGHDDDGISLLVKCALDQHLDFETIQCPALRIIEAVSFGDEITCKKMSDDNKLMDYIKYLSNVDDSSLGPTANRIRWKVEDENKFISDKIKKELTPATLTNSYDANNSNNHQISFNYNWDLPSSKTSDMFDLIISYHHSDKDICSQIYERLTASCFYRISFDRERVHEILPDAMAEAIEKSSIVLMCFSSKYQQSYACRMAAEYAEKRQRPIIPMNLDELYCPTGWLNNIVASKQCINIVKYNLNSSYANLIQQIDNIKKQINIK